MNIGAGNNYPANALSNFAPHKFTFSYKGFIVECASMEGLLQSFKFKNPEMQKYVCSLVGKAAKYKGKEKDWRRTQTLWWNGEEIDRHSQEYQDLLDAAYEAMFANESFRKALAASGNAVLKHTIGKSNESDTVLTQSEFTSRLTKLRNKLPRS